LGKPATLEFFYRRANGILRAECKDCFRALKNARAAANREHTREIARRSYRQVDGAAAKRRSVARKPELYAAINAQYELTHAVNRRARRIELHSLNRDENNAKSREWYYANVERGRATSLAWIKQHPERARLNTEKTRVRRKGAPGILPTENEWAVKVAWFEGRCAYCFGLPTRMELDHVIPLSKGGSHGIENVVPACYGCNRHKAAKLLVDWLDI
jgi:5-methylcytosine-specific restriction endonuclease McrA